MQLKPSRTPLAGRGCFGRSFAHVDLPMAVDMEQLQVVRRVPTTSAAPDAMMDLTVLLCQAQWLTADPTSSLLSLPEIFDLPVTCPRLGQLPCATAFTIRAWSRRTVCQTFLQSMECQSGVWSGAAPASIAAADMSACLPESVGQGSLVTEHPREVSPLSRRGNVVRGRIHPLSSPLQSGLRFLPHPFPAVSSAFFTVRLPVRERQRG
jgi:hypothetical protein